MSLSQEIHAKVFKGEVLCLELTFKRFRGREKNVGKMSTIGKSSSLGEGYIGECSLTIEFNKTKSKWGRKEVEEDIPKREAQGLAWQDRKERTRQSSTQAAPKLGCGPGLGHAGCWHSRGHADTDLERLTI